MSRSLILLFSLLFLAACTLLESEEDNDVDENTSVSQQCTYDGVNYDIGDSFPDTEDCNTCTCDEGGYISCTEMACIDTPDDSETKKSCTVDGKVYASGESFKDSDDCNTCSCYDGGAFYPKMGCVTILIRK